MCISWYNDKHQLIKLHGTNIKITIQGVAEMSCPNYSTTLNRFNHHNRCGGTCYTEVVTVVPFLTCFLWLQWRMPRALVRHVDERVSECQSVSHSVIKSLPNQVSA